MQAGGDLSAQSTWRRVDAAMEEGDGYACCPLCRGRRKDGVWAINCPCGHLFHEGCLQKAHAKNLVCPLCKVVAVSLIRVFGPEAVHTCQEVEELRSTISRLQSDVIKAGTKLECQNAQLRKAVTRIYQLKAELDSCRVLHVLGTNGVAEADILIVMNSCAFPKDCNMFAAVLALRKKGEEHLHQQVATLEATLQATHDSAAAAADAVLEGMRRSQATHKAELQRERDSGRQQVEFYEGMLAQYNEHWAQQDGARLCFKEEASPSFKCGNAGGIKTAMGMAGMGAVKLGAPSAGKGRSFLDKAGQADLRVANDGRGAVHHAPVLTQRTFKRK